MLTHASLINHAALFTQQDMFENKLEHMPLIQPTRSYELFKESVSKKF